MFWIKLGILLIGFLFAGILPGAVRKSIQHIKIDLNTQTLSFLSNKSLYGKEYAKGYKRLLFASSILLYGFFWLLSEFYDLGQHEKLMQYIDICVVSLTLLAFVPHNLKPYSLDNFTPALQRFFHNLLAVVVFLSIPALIVTYQFAIIEHKQFLGLLGLIVIGLVILATALSFLKSGINGATELLFINGISIWTIFVTIMTILS